MAAVNTRVQLSDADRKVICELARDNKDLSQDKLTALAATTLKKPGLKRPTVTGILSKRDKWLNISDSAASSKVKHRGPKHANLEAALIEWFGQLRVKNALITDSLVTEKAKALAEKLDITDFQFSDGWLWKFKQRHNIKLQRPHGESGAADLEGVDIARTVVAKIITELGYKLEDVYNFDETGLYYRAKPSKTLAVGKTFYTVRYTILVSLTFVTCAPCMAGSVQGMKMQKDCIMVSVCVNATGTDRLKLVMIHTAKRPRDFGRVWQPLEHVDYFANTKAWMTMQASSQGSRTCSLHELAQFSTTQHMTSGL